jgi:hypothetical protein
MAASQSHDILPMENAHKGIITPNDFNERSMEDHIRNQNNDLAH